MGDNIAKGLLAITDGRQAAISVMLYITRHTNTRSHLWKITTWWLICRGLTVFWSRLKSPQYSVLLKTFCHGPNCFYRTKFQGSFSVGQISYVQFGQDQMSGNPSTWMYHLFVLFGKKKKNSYMHKLKKWLSVGDVRNRERLVKDDKISAIKWIRSKDLT